MADTVDGLIALAPDHASLYLLELYPNAPLREAMARASWSLAPDDDAAEMYLWAMARLDQSGYSQYEISNVARPGRESRHNLKYWRDGEWLGFGCGAHSTRGALRWKNVAGTAEYVARVRGGPRTGDRTADPHRAGATRGRVVHRPAPHRRRRPRPPLGRVTVWTSGGDTALRSGRTSTPAVYSGATAGFG